MTKRKIEQLAREIREFLDDKFLNGDCRIYFNGMCWEHGTEDDPYTWDENGKEWLELPKRSGWNVIEEINPKDYFEYASGIICMSFEGSFYDVMNGYSKSDFKKQDEFYNLLQKYGCYYELGNAWNLSVYEN